MKYCPKCKNPMSSDATTCPVCLFNQSNNNYSDKIIGNVLDDVIDVGNLTRNEKYNIDNALEPLMQYFAVSDYALNKVRKGPYKKEARELAIRVYELTPGQGKKIATLCETFESNLGNIKYLLEEIMKYAETAVYVNKELYGLVEATNTYEFLDKVAPNIYDHFKQKCLIPAVEISNAKQKKANEECFWQAANQLDSLHQANEKAEHDKLTDGVSDQNLVPRLRFCDPDVYTEDQKVVYNPPIEKQKGCYKVGYPITSLAVNKNYMNGGNVSIGEDKYIGEPADAYVNIKQINIIISDLSQILTRHIKVCKECIEDWVREINAVDGYVGSIGRLNIEKVDPELRKLEQMVNRLHTAYSNFYKDALTLSKGSGDVDIKNKTAQPTTSSGGNTNRSYSGGVSKVSSTLPTLQNIPKLSEENKESIPHLDTTPSTVQKRINTQESTPISGTSHAGNISINKTSYANYNSESIQSLTTENPDEELPIENDMTIKGNEYELPTSAKMVSNSIETTQKANKNNLVAPVLTGLAAAAAAAVGTKIYLDKKSNENTEKKENFDVTDWSPENEINIETNQLERL